MGNGRESDVIEDEECRRLFAELSEYERMASGVKIEWKAFRTGIPRPIVPGYTASE